MAKAKTKMTYTFDENIVSDLYKEAYNVRPGDGWWSRWHQATDDTKQLIWDELMLYLDWERHENARKAAADAMHVENLVLKYMNLGAKTREQAIRWYIQSLDLSKHDLYQGGDYVCYISNIHYSLAHHFNAVARQLAEEML